MTVASSITMRSRALLCLWMLPMAVGLAFSRRAGAVDAPIVLHQADPVTVSLERFGRSIQRSTLANGLRLVLNPDHAASTVAVSVTYGVGSSSETIGRTGFAHLFEHMMFQGSKHAEKGAHFRLISERGGTLNGTTDSDRTNYYEVLPATELELALWLEADRMRWLALTPANFENQRAVVKEEFRMRVENQAYAPAAIRLEELVFKGYAPYAHDTIGSMADLDAAQFAWVKAFHDEEYRPNNAVLTIAGDFEVERARELVDRYFGPIESRMLPARAMPPMPQHPNSEQALVADGNARTPAIMLGFMVPPSRTADHYALELLSLLLADGETSRLYKSLVHDRALVESVSAGCDGHKGPDQLSVTAVLTDKGRLPEVEASIWRELDALRTTPPTPEELYRVKRQLRTSFLFGLQTNLNRAIRLGEFESLWGDASLLANELPRYLEVTPADVQRVVTQYLTPERSSKVEVQPVKGASS